MPEAYEKIYKYYLFAQRQIRDQLLTQKYQVLLSQSFLSNPVEAKLAFDSRSSEADLLLAALPASSRLSTTKTKRNTSSSSKLVM